MKNERGKLKSSNYTKKVTRLAVLVAFAMVLTYLETLLPPIIPLAPGCKVGLGNIVVLLAMFTLGLSQAALILLAKCLFSCIFGGGVFALVYSVSGGAASFLVMVILYFFCSKYVSVLAISIAGAVVHNLTQTGVAVLVLGQINFLSLLPLVLLASVAAGIVVGIVVYLIVKGVPKKILGLTN